MITNYIGQTEAVGELNQILAAIRNERKAGNSYAVRPIRLGGWTGAGKSHLANCMAEQLADLDFNYIEVPPNAGWKDLYRVFTKIASVDVDSGKVSAIPYVIFWDEFHSQKVAVDLLKAMMTKVDEVHTITRQGFPFIYDPVNHIHIVASNFTLDKAMQRRLRNLELTDYTPSEMKRIALLKFGKAGVKIDESGLESIVSRTKPYPGDIEEIMSPITTFAKAKGESKVSASEVETILKKQGFFKGGLRKADIQLLNELRKGPKTVSILRCEVMDEKKRSTQERVDWLCHARLVQPVRNAFALTDKGIEYMKAIAEAQKKAKGK